MDDGSKVSTCRWTLSSRIGARIQRVNRVNIHVGDGIIENWYNPSRTDSIQLLIKMARINLGYGNVLSASSFWASTPKQEPYPYLGGL